MDEQQPSTSAYTDSHEPVTEETKQEVTDAVHFFVNALKEGGVINSEASSCISMRSKLMGEGILQRFWEMQGEMVFADVQQLLHEEEEGEQEKGKQEEKDAEIDVPVSDMEILSSQSSSTSQSDDNYEPAKPPKTKSTEVSGPASPTVSSVSPDGAPLLSETQPRSGVQLREWKLVPRYTSPKDSIHVPRPVSPLPPSPSRECKEMAAQMDRVTPIRHCHTTARQDQDTQTRGWSAESEEEEEEEPQRWGPIRVTLTQPHISYCERNLQYNQRRG
ncbi:hypothetical protein X777_06931 [Ooceraea biroi]|uniref:Uncharacterized protein n=1 Tax=Ooceraea biroi TaxID=2015173 RepID=A0A026WC15_OOCBI|nr:hypothetical protein X777_06931 [Ooceraea biroi]